MGEAVIGKPGIPRPERISVIRVLNSYIDLIGAPVSADSARPLRLPLDRGIRSIHLLRNVAEILEPIDQGLGADAVSTRQAV